MGSARKICHQQKIANLPSQQRSPFSSTFLGSTELEYPVSVGHFRWEYELIVPMELLMPTDRAMTLKRVCPPYLPNASSLQHHAPDIACHQSTSLHLRC